MNPERPQTTGALLAGGAAVLLIGSLFLRWYTLEFPARVRETGAELPTFTGFEGLERADVAIVVAAGLAILIAGLVVAGLTPNSTAPASRSSSSACSRSRSSSTGGSSARPASSSSASTSI